MHRKTISGWGRCSGVAQHGVSYIDEDTWLDAARYSVFQKTRQVPQVGSPVLPPFNPLVWSLQMPDHQ